MKIALTIGGVVTLLAALLAATISGLATAVFGSPDTTADCTRPIADIPPDYCALYQLAAPQCPNLHWTVLAAIGKAETDHGRSRLPGVHSGSNEAGAGGPMQFLQPTFDTVISHHRIPPGGATPPSRYNPHDAIHAAAFYLCDSGADRGDLRAALYAYNHADWYVDLVLRQAEKYAQAAGPNLDCFPESPPNPIAAAAIRFACNQLGQPYVWGGDGPHEGGYDCSGLTKAAYAAAGVNLPRVAHDQWLAGPQVSDQGLLPGDLVFYGNPSVEITHVGVYIGRGRMINAPTFGQPVQVAAYRWPGDAYAGATRLWRPAQM